MKLLFDENLSPKLAQILTSEFPESNHVQNIGLKGKDDNRIWMFGKEQGFTIVSKDTDFRERSYVEGAPPKIIWLDVGNVGTEEIADLLKRESHRIKQFESQSETSFLILSLTAQSL